MHILDKYLVSLIKFLMCYAVSNRICLWIWMLKSRVERRKTELLKLVKISCVVYNLSGTHILEILHI